MPPTPLLEVLSIFQNKNLPRTATGFKPTPCKARNPSLAVLKLSSIYRQVRPSIRQMESLRLRKLQTAQDSCQRLAKHKPEKLPNVTFGIQKNTSLQLSDIGRNTSRYARLESLRNHLEIGPCKTGPKASNSSRFVPKACDAHARKTAER